MRFQHWFLLHIFVSTFSFLSCLSQPNGEVKEPQPFMVRVLLEKQNDSSSLVWKIESKKGFLISDPLFPQRQDRLLGQECVITYKNKALWIGNRKLAISQLKIVSEGGNLIFAGREYAGSLLIAPENNMWHIINTVELEDYVCSVLRSESWPGWPLEVNKAFAIMHRSYAVAKMIQARQKKKRGKHVLFDIGCTNKDQTYQGFHDFAVLRQAVEETRGVVIAFQKKPVMAMYDTCCGGLIPAKMKGIDFRGSPYLARAYPCTFCTNCKVHSWKVTYPLSLCEKMLSDANVTSKNLFEIKVARSDPAGIVEEVRMKCGNAWKKVTGKKIYNIFKDIKSFSFSISQHAQAVTFTGIGYGHHLGLCQWGARQMVSEGWRYNEILKFYYPGTTFMLLGRG